MVSQVSQRMDAGPQESAPDPGSPAGARRWGFSWKKEKMCPPPQQENEFSYTAVTNRLKITPLSYCLFPFTIVEMIFPH